KLTNEVEAPVAGYVIKIVAREGDVIPSREVMDYIGEEGESVGTSDTSQATSEAEAETEDEEKEKNEAQTPTRPKRETSDGERIFITPVARKMAEEKGIDIRDVNGT